MREEEEKIMKFISDNLHLISKIRKENRNKKA
jgi:hypothetical protein